MGLTMFFSRFFKPKWQSRSPQTRREALLALNLADPASLTIVRQAAESDTDPVNRQTALRRLTDVELLRRLADSDPDATVREHAVQRLGDLISAVDAQGASVAQRRSWLENSADKRVLEYVARNGADPHMRWLAAQMLDRESLYSDLAIYDADTEVRSSAAARITSRGALERVLRHARTRDKRVRAEIQARLDELTAEQDRPARVRKMSRELCLQIEALPDIWAKSHRLDDVTSQRSWVKDKWQELLAQRQGLESEPWQEWDARFAAALQAIDEVIDAAQKAAAADVAVVAEESSPAPVAAEIGRDRTAYFETIAQLTKDLAQTPLPLETLTERVEQAQAAFNQFVGDEQLKDELSVLESNLEQARNAVASFQEQQPLMEELQVEVNNLLRADGFLDGALVKSVEQGFKRLNKPNLVQEWRDMHGAIKALMAQVKERVEQEKAQRREVIDQVAANVKSLDELLKDGKSSDAAQLARQLHALVDGMGEAEVQALKRKGVLGRLHRAQGQLRELKDWQEWASTPVREQLCQEAEALAEETTSHATHPHYDFAAAARRVREARQRWRGLGPAEPGVGEQLWERFNAACNRAYEPCQQHFDQEAQTRDANHHAREALCVEAEEFWEKELKDKDPQQVDWRGAEKFLRDHENAWRKAGPVERKAFALLQERFKQATGKLRDALTGERDNNHAKKAALVKRAEKLAAALQEGADDNQVRNAVDQMKQLQEQWRRVGPASQEKNLWQAFTAAREAINAAMQSQFDFVATERQKIRDTRIALCERMEALAGSDLDPGQAKAEFEAIKDAWDALDSDKEKPVRSLDRRFNTAAHEFDKRREKYAANAKSAEREHLRQRGEICDALEALADSVAVGQVDLEAVLNQIQALEQRWSELTVARAQLARGVSQRFDQALSRLRENAGQLAEELRRQNTERKEKLAVRWEILADIESPPHARDARMAVQVAQLAEKMTSGGSRSNGSGAEEERIGLLAEWCGTGPIDGVHAVELNERFRRAYESLYQRGR